MKHFSLNKKKCLHIKGYFMAKNFFSGEYFCSRGNLQKSIIKNSQKI